MMIHTKTRKKVVFYIAAFIMPLVLLILLFICNSIAPFGDNTLAFSDAHNQYISFFKYYKDMFFGKQDVFYSLEKTLGGSMAGLYAYYLASPFNLIFLLFSEFDILIAFDLMIAIKLSCCGLTAAFFLGKKDQLNLKTLVITTSYALCGYNIAFCWSTMWLDAVILLPLVANGIDRICRDESPTLYIVALSISIITSFYMGFIICVFSVLYFLYIEYIDGKIKFKSLKCFLLSSLFSGGISSFILVPAILSFSGGKRQSGIEIVWSMLERVYNYVLSKIVPEGQERLSQYMRPMMIIGLICFAILIIGIFYIILSNSKKNRKLFIAAAIVLTVCFCGFYFIIEQFVQGQNDILTKLLFGAVDYDEVFNGHPNIYAGELILLLSISYFLCRKIPTREKRASFAFCLIIIFSMALYIPNLAWHGFTKNACFNFRYSFILSFFLMTLSAKAIDEVEIKELSCSVLGLLLIIVITLIKRPAYVQQWQYIYEVIISVIVSLAVAFYMKHKSCFSTIVLIVVGILPVLIVSNISIRNESEEAIKNSYYREMYEDGSNTINTIKKEDGGLYRIRKEGKWLNLNDPMTFTYYGVSHYSSTEKASTIEYLEELGVVTYQNIWASVDESKDDFNDDALGIKYILKSNGEIEINSDYRSIVSLSGRGTCSTEVNKDSYLIINAECETDQNLIVTIPYEKGWKAIVNGHKAEIQVTDKIFMSIPLEAGENCIELTFTPPGLVLGIIISVMSLIALYLMSRKMGTHFYSKKPVETILF